MPEIYAKLDKVLQAGHRAKERVKQILAFNRQAVTERIVLQPASLVTEAGKGTGMGLAVAHGIIKSYGGAISIDSQPGKGTAVTYFFRFLNATCPSIIAGASPQPKTAHPNRWDRGRTYMRIGRISRIDRK